MGRSIAAVASGFLLVLATLSLASLAIWLINPEALPGPAEVGGPVTTNNEALLLLIAFSLLCGLLGGYLTGVLAEHQEGGHGLAAGLFVLIALAVATFVAQAGYIPLWYQVALPLAGGAATALGGFLRQHKRRISA